MFKWTKSRALHEIDIHAHFYMVCLDEIFYCRPNQVIFPTEIFPSFVLPGNAIMLPHLTTCILREVKNKRKFQILISKSDRGRLLEVVADKRFQI